MERSRAGLVYHALPPALGFAASLAFSVLLLWVFLSGHFGFDPAALTQAAERVAVTLPLALLALLFAAGIGIPAGCLAALAPSLAGSLLGTVARVLISVPAVWIGMMLMLLVGLVFRQPLAGGFMPWQQNPFGAIGSLLLPAFALSLPLAGLLMRRVRRDVAALAVSPQVLGARLAGATETQALLGQWGGVATGLAGWLGERFGTIVAGAMIIENLFYLPGLGRLLFDAVAAADMAVTAAALLLLVGLAALARFAGDLTAATLDPRAGDTR